MNNPQYAIACIKATLAAYSSDSTREELAECRSRCLRAIEDDRGATAPTPAPQLPSIGRIVHYRLKAEDAGCINRRRTNGQSIKDRINEGKWPLGAQAHIGNTVNEGLYLPAIVVAITPGEDMVNLQVFLDGNDTYWATSRHAGDGPGTWTWPPRQ